MAPGMPLLDGVSLAAAEAAFRAAVTPLEAVSLPLEQAGGLALAETVVAPFPLPPFANSAMDGYALRAADVTSASPHCPVSLPIVGTAAAGHAFARELDAGQAARIMTGGRLPAGSDTVLPIEAAVEAKGRLIVTAPVEAGRHVRRAGEDLTTGTIAVATGATLGAAELAILAALGKANVSVVRRPRVAVLTTGDELRMPGEPRDGGAVYNANRFALCAQVLEAGGEPLALPTVADTIEATVAALVSARAADAIVTSAGIGAGQRDSLANAARRLGRFTEGSVRLRPARHVGVGEIGGVPLFALPGNPSASLIAFELLVRPALRRLGGHTSWRRPVLWARVAEPVRSVKGVAQALWVRLESATDGYRVREAGHQGAGMLGTATRADGLLIVPEHVEGYRLEELAAVRLLTGVVREDLAASPPVLPRAAVQSA